MVLPVVRIAPVVGKNSEALAKQIIGLYLQRWPVETFYQDGKGHLGLDQYRMRTIEAIKKHWCLVLVAYCFLHLQCLPSSLIESYSHQPLLPSKSIGQVCCQQSEFLVQSLILFAHDLLNKGLSATDVFSKLFAKQHKFAFIS